MTAKYFSLEGWIEWCRENIPNNADVSDEELEAIYFKYFLQVVDEREKEESADPKRIKVARHVFAEEKNRN